MADTDEKLYRWCAIDAEGDAGERGLLGVAFFSDTLQAYLTDHDEICEQLTHHAQHGYTFLMHNAAYDIPVIFWQLKIPMRMVYYNSRFNRGQWKYSPRKPMCQAWDTLALSGGIPLSKLGTALSLPKYPTPQRLLGKDPDKYLWQCDKHQAWECEECYAVRDAEIVYRFMLDFQLLLRGWDCQIHRRISAVSMEVWRKLDNPSDIALHDRRIIDLARKSYAGGRVETYKLGHIQDAYSADVCSMYPSVMTNTDYPDPSHMIYQENMPADRINWNLEGVAECDVSIPFTYLPPLPYQYKGQRMYPCGRVKYSWTYHELRYAMQQGVTINHVHRTAFSTHTVRPFRDFIGVLWELRSYYESKGDPRTLFAKLLMNNLYGRLGMRAAMDERIMFPYPAHTGSEDWPGYQTDEIASTEYLFKDTPRNFRHKWSNILWASQTTAAARVLLHRFMLMQGSNILYCDTDSVFSRAPIVGTGDGLGSLRDEQHYEWLYIAQPKLYAYALAPSSMPDSWYSEPCRKHNRLICDECRVNAKAKGVPREHALEYLLNGSASYTQPVKPIESRRRNIAAGTWTVVTRSRELVPHRRQPTAPGELLHETGWSDTAPPVIGPLPSNIKSLVLPPTSDASTA